jgi:type I restriction enzyme S subunit
MNGTGYWKGVVMSKWKMVKLGDVCNPVKNIDNSFFVKNEYFEYLDIASIDKESKCIVNSVTTAIVEAPSRAKQPVVTGDLLVSTVRPNLNAVAFIEDKYDGCIASTGFCVLRPNVNNVHSRYIFYFIRTKKFVEYLINLATGASYPAVSDKIIKSCPIPLPPLPEQQRIVNLLDRAQELIDKRKKQLELMDSLVQSVFYEMFGDRSCSSTSAPTSNRSRFISRNTASWVMRMRAEFSASRILASR